MSFSFEFMWGCWVPWAFCSVGRYSSGGAAGAECDGVCFGCGRESGKAFPTRGILQISLGAVWLGFFFFFLLVLWLGSAPIQEEGSGLLLLFIA